MTTFSLQAGDSSLVPNIPQTSCPFEILPSLIALVEALLRPSFLLNPVRNWTDPNHRVCAEYSLSLMKALGRRASR
jgi:hypothetical protein